MTSFENHINGPHPGDADTTPAGASAWTPADEAQLRVWQTRRERALTPLAHMLDKHSVPRSSIAVAAEKLAANAVEFRAVLEAFVEGPPDEQFRAWYAEAMEAATAAGYSGDSPGEAIAHLADEARELKASRDHAWAMLRSAVGDPQEPGLGILPRTGETAEEFVKRTTPTDAEGRAFSLSTLPTLAETPNPLGYTPIPAMEAYRPESVGELRALIREAFHLLNWTVGELRASGSISAEEDATMAAAAELLPRLKTAGF